MILETKRLLLRPWQETDAEELYRYASDPDVGPAAGWPTHKSIEESLDVIRKVFCGPECYAVCQKEDGRDKAIGCIELKLKGHTDKTDKDSECELGYWLGKPFWGNGLIPEAAEEMLRRAFKDLDMEKVWCGHYDGNVKSERVQEKLGFRYQWTKKNVDVPLLHEKRTDHVRSLSREEWQWDEMQKAAEAVRGHRKVSDYVEAGGVAAAILSGSGEIYTGVCVDTSCTLGVCAERNAIFHMLTCGESQIKKVLAIMPDGRAGAPCGACRELMAQLMPETYKDIQVMLDLEKRETITLGELTPRWWI